MNQRVLGPNWCLQKDTSSTQKLGFYRITSLGLRPLERKITDNYISLFSVVNILRRFRLRLMLEESFKHFQCFPRDVEDAVLTTVNLNSMYACMHT